MNKLGRDEEGGCFAFCLLCRGGYSVLLTSRFAWAGMSLSCNLYRIILNAGDQTTNTSQPTNPPVTVNVGAEEKTP